MSLNWLLVFVPVAVALEHLAPGLHSWIFLASALAIIPLAGLMGEATETLANRTGAGVGGLLNATFGNAAELIIALAALRAGLHDVVKASIAGCIIANALLVLGAAMLAGGLRYPTQRFNAAAARAQATMLTLAAIALMLPAAYQAGVRADASRLPELSVAISLVLIACYVCSLVFSLVTHRQLFGAGAEGEGDGSAPSPRRALITLAAATALIAWMSEILVGVVEPAAKEIGLNSVFVGVFAVALLANAAEYITAIRVARKDRMDLSLSIAIGAGVQIALFLTPVLVLASFVIGPAPLDLAFPPGLVMAVLLSVLICAQVAGDGEASWLKGVQLLAVYAILAIAFYYLPEAPAPG